MKTLMVIDPQRCSECEDCINACKQVHGVARTKKTSTVPVFCLQCHPDKAPCARICPTGAIQEEDGTLIVDEDICILCRLCMIACPVGMLSLIHILGSTFTKEYLTTDVPDISNWITELE